MAFHVEISRSFRRAQAFNLSETELRRRVLGPWAEGGPVEIGEREWDPGKSELRVLEGPELDAQELAFGQGWSNAARKARDVTRELVAPSAPAVAVLADTAGARAAVLSMVEGLGLRVVESTADARAVVIVVEGEPTAERAYQLGVAAGSLGGRVVVVALPGAAVPPYLEGAITIDPEQPEAPQALAERLRRITGG